ncbi:MAG TPA: glycerophosphodiester phosphodiesterase family protein [Mucilaginibacter sp.]|nr:glycerophosphodiester phosphodiesterase family protein [Mucilaginibacter sp.]
MNITPIRNHTKILFAAVIMLSISAAKAQNPAPKARHRYIVVAHRGDHTVYPENTIEGYAAAIKDGADYIEIDLRTTSDGKLVSMHDATVNRMTDSVGLVKNFSLNEIEKLKVKPKGQSGETVYRVPTFEQILQLCRNKIYIYIDFKEADAAATLALLKKYQMQRQVLVYINKPSQLADWRKTDAAMPLMLSMPDSVKTPDGVKNFIAQYHPDILDGSYNTYSRAMVDYADSVNIPVWPDAQSRSEGPQVWENAIALGLKGLQTDNPPALIKYLEEKGLR